jgi:alpha-tubulin suppressor-like RCC1 family protein
LQSITLSPNAPSIPLATSARLTAIATLNDGSTRDVTSIVSWSSSAPSVATVSNAAGSQGLVSALSQGTTLILVTDPTTGISQSEGVTVTGAVLHAITVTPPSLSVPIGTSAQLTALGVYSDGSTADLTQSVTWSSSSGAVQVSNPPGASGQVTALAQGGAVVTATDPTSAVSGQTTVSVTAAVLRLIAVTPINASIPSGTNRAFHAIATFSDGRTDDVTIAVTWSTSANASISNALGSNGLATGTAVGPATIIATDPATQISGSVGAMITAPIAVSLQITLPSTVLLGQTPILSATMGLSDGTTLNVSDKVIWSGTPNVRVQGSMLTALATGTATITATDPVSQLSATAPLSITLATPISIAAGGFHNCALLADDTVECWGLNLNGQLGNGTTIDSSTPTLVPGLSDVRAIAAGTYHTCAIVGTGVKCWGDNEYGQLGSAPSSQSPYAVPVPLSVPNLPPIVAIAAGAFHTCAVTSSDGSIWCWGYGLNGELGNGANSNSSTPVQVSNFRHAIGIAAGGEATSGSHTCAVSVLGSVSCWGYNGFGELGDGTTTSSSQALIVSGLPSIAILEAHANISCATPQAGSSLCWGNGGFYALGNGSAANSSVPVIPQLAAGSIIAPGVSNGCARVFDDTVECWGYNGNGELGNGTNDTATLPVTIADLTGAGVKAITAGDNHTCVLLPSGAIECWGFNHFGQLGNGNTTSSTTPVTVLGGSGSTACQTNPPTEAVDQSWVTDFCGSSSTGYVSQSSTEYSLAQMFSVGSTGMLTHVQLALHGSGAFSISILSTEGGFPNADAPLATLQFPDGSGIGNTQVPIGGSGLTMTSFDLSPSNLYVTAGQMLAIQLRSLSPYVWIGFCYSPAYTGGVAYEGISVGGASPSWMSFYPPPATRGLDLQTFVTPICQ